MHVLCEFSCWTVTDNARFAAVWVVGERFSKLLAGEQLARQLPAEIKIKLRTLSELTVGAVTAKVIANLTERS